MATNYFYAKRKDFTMDKNYYKYFNITPETEDGELVRAIHFEPMAWLKFYIPYDSRRPEGDKGWFEGVVLKSYPWYITMLVPGKKGMISLTINKKDLFIGEAKIKGWKFDIYKDRDRKITRAAG